MEDFMENENLENQSGNVKQNPSRDNQNINQGQSNEKKFGSDDTSKKEVGNKDVNLDRSGISSPKTSESADFSGGEQNREQQQQQQQPGQGQSQGQGEKKSSESSGGVKSDENLKNFGGSQGENYGQSGSNIGQNPSEKQEDTKRQ
jgi:hypothetical protein